jgi:hypothetical protein
MSTNRGGLIRLRSRGAVFALTTGLAACSWEVAPALAKEASLCSASETKLFSCPIHGKIVSVCGLSGGKAEYRFGRLGRLELQSRDLHVADTGFSGGGEDQIYLLANGYRYIVYSTTVRTDFGPDGHNDPQFTSGLVVQKDGRTISSPRCGGEGDQPVDTGSARRFMPVGPFASH